MSELVVRPKAKPGVLSISPYVGGQSRVEGREDAIKLSSNESPFGPSPAVAAAVAAAAAHLADYPDGASFDLRDALARKYGLAAERIICGNGSDELLHLIAQCYLGPDTEAIYSEHGFLVYKIVTQAADARCVVVPEVDLTAHVDGILAAVTPKTRVVFVANPNNPTGTYLPVDEVRRLHAGLPGHVLLVLDAAYAEYVRRNDYEAGIELVATNDNVVMTRTFSKIYGLAGLRLGWAYCPAEVAQVLNKVRPPFNVNSVAQAAGVAALEDQAHIDKARAHNEQWRAWCSDELTRLGLTVTPSIGNFILIHFAGPEQAGAADKFLQGRGLILRQVAGYGLPQALRMTIGSQEACKGVVEGLKQFLGGASS